MRVYMLEKQLCRIALSFSDFNGVIIPTTRYIVSWL